MRSSFRILSQGALLTALSVGQLTGCLGGASDQPITDNQQAGSMRLPLQAVAPSGNVYRLRDANFELFNRTTGQVQFLSSEDFLSSSEITIRLARGDYEIRLLDGWVMEQLSGGGGSGGTGGSGTGGFFPGGVGGEPEPVPGGRAGTTPRPIPPPFEEGGAAGDVGVAGTGGFISLGGSTGFGGKSGMGGIIGKGGGSTSGGAPGNFVEAVLQDSPVQFFSIFGREDVFINFHFMVGKDVISTNSGTVHVGFTVEEQCERPAGSLDAHRVLIEHNRDAMQLITMRDVFTAISKNDGQAGDPVRLYQEVIDSFASVGNGRLPDSAHCGDERTNGAPSLNGFPLVCDRAESRQIDNIDAWKPLAFVNRMDLAPINGAHCGQQRIVFGNNAQVRMFLIFEAQIPNPSPELGAQGCLPLANFWLEANGMSDAKARGDRLTRAFLSGDPALAEAGFGPFVSATHYTVGSGQIRSNSFDQDPWTLREFKLAVDESGLKAIPFPVAESPNGGLWDERLALPQGDACRESFLEGAQGLLVNNPSDMSFIVAEACKDAESRNDFSQDYSSRMSPSFRQILQERFAPSGLTPEDIATRAQFAGSCIGCHSEATGRFLGAGVFAPFSSGFTHVDEFDTGCSTEPGQCSNLSPAMNDVFLPRRLEIFANLLGVEPPADPCGNTGSGGSAGAAGAVGVGGGIVGPPPPRGGSTGGPVLPPPILPPPILPEPTPGPAPIIDIQLPSAEATVPDLQAEDAAIRANFGNTTFGNRDARVTH